MFSSSAAARGQAVGRLATLGLALALLLVLAAPAAASFTLGGLSDQHPESLLDPRLRTELSMTGARLVVRWDAALADPGPVDAWLSAAAARGLKPFVVFNRTPGTRCPAQPCVLPTVADYTRAFTAFRQRWPAVTEFGPWNEANVASQPTATNPQRAAEYYNAMVGACPTCTVVGAELLDATNAASYVQAMRAFIPVEPRAWGIHNYEDVNHLRTSGTDALLRVTTTEIWLTEGAGLVRYVDGSGRVTYPFDEARAADATSFMFDYVDAHLDRIGRLYYYGLQNRSADDDLFDTALLRRDGSKRPAWAVVAARMHKLVPAVTAPPAPARPAPMQLLRRNLRIIRGGLAVGPLRCLKASKPRCRGRLEVRWHGKLKPFGKRRISLRAGRTSSYRIHVGPKNRRRLRRKSSNHRVTFVIRLTRPRAFVKSYPRMKIVRRR